MQALQTGEVSRRDIDIADCRATGKILAGQAVQNKVVERLHAALLEYREQKQQQKVDNRADTARLCKRFGFSLVQRRAGGSREPYYSAGKRF